MVADRAILGIFFRTASSIAVEQRLELPPSLGPEESMELIDHDEFERAEQTRDAGSLKDEERFQRFGSDEKDSSGTFQEVSLALSANVAVPARYRDFRVVAQLLKSAELIVDQRL